MSFPKKDRKIRLESGKTFPDDARAQRKSSFAKSVSDALKRQFGGGAAAVKEVVSLTGANERAVKNWFDGKNGPSGEHLVALLQHSDAVLETVLVMAGRDDLAKAKEIIDARRKLEEMMAMIDAIQGR